jgi:hypothetical protein
MLQETFIDNAMSQSKTLLWYKHFKDGRTFVDNNEGSGRLSTSTALENMAKVCKTILADCRQTIPNVCEIVVSHKGLFNAFWQTIWTWDAKFLPRLMSDDQKAHRVSVSRELKQEARVDSNFISNIITSDETWVYDYDPETKQQSSQWKSPNSSRPNKVHQVCSNVKSMLIVFFNIQGIVH